MNETTAYTKKKKKKGNGGLIVAGVATAAAVGVGVYFWSSSSSAKGNGSGPGSGKGSGASGGRGGGSGSGGGSGAGGGGTQGPGGAGGGGGGGGKPGGGKARGGGKGSKPKGGGDSDDARKNDPKGFWWGDRSKVPADFDYQGNQIWISPDRTAAAAGFYFFLDGINAQGERITWDEDGLSFLIADGTILTPTQDVDHREDAVPNLKKILGRKNPDTGELALDSVFSWIAAYYGTAVSAGEAATSRAADLVQDMVNEASALNGGRKGPLVLDGPLRDFYGYARTRLDMGRKAIYGDGFPWGQGEDVLS